MGNILGQDLVIAELEQRLVAATTLTDRDLWQGLLEEARSCLDVAIAGDDEKQANFAWFLSEVAFCWAEYLAAFALLQEGLFYESWCKFERIEISLLNLRENALRDRDLFRLSFLDTRVKEFQSLYPYAMFFSPEIIVGHETCSICQQKINPWRFCGHRVGRVYKGRLCYREAHDIEFISISLVTKPVQKYSVGFMQDENGNTIDHYDYSMVKFVIDRLRSPTDGFSTEWRSAYHPHELFSHISMKDSCPCGSGIVYGDCCRERPGVIRPHLQIWFEKDPPLDLPNQQLAGYDGIPRVEGHL